MKGPRNSGQGGGLKRPVFAPFSLASTPTSLSSARNCAELCTGSAATNCRRAATIAACDTSVRHRDRRQLEHVPPELNSVRIPRAFWMANSIGIDSLLGEGTMPAAYSADIRGRVIASVESGSSRREAAEEFDVSASSAIKWVAAYRTTGSCAAKPRGGSTSPLEKYTTFLLTLIEGQPDLTLDEVVCAMRKRKLPGSRTAVWRFFQRHKITFKKKPERGGAAARRRGAGAATLDARTGHV